MKNVFSNLNLLHLLNDGFFASLFILLPFISEDIEISLSKAGVLGSLLRISTFAFVIPISFLAVKYGSYKVLLGSLCMYALSTFFAGFATSYIHLLIIFSLAGFGFSSFHAQSYGLVAKIATKEKRHKLLGNISAFGEVGKLMFTSITTLAIGYVGWRHFLKVSGIAGIGIFIMLTLVAVKYFKNVLSIKVSSDSSEIKNGYGSLMREPNYIKVMVASGIDYFASGSLFMFLPFLLLEKGFDPKIVGSLTAVLFVGAIFGKAFLSRLSSKVGDKKLFFIAELSMTTLIVTLVFAKSFPILLIAITLLGIVTKGTGPLLTILISKSIDHLENYDKAFSISEFTEKFLGTIAPALFGIVGDTLGINYSFYIMAGTCIIAALPILLLHLPETGGQKSQSIVSHV